MNVQNTIHKAHSKAIKDAVKKLPRTDANKVIRYVKRLFDGEDLRSLEQEIAAEYGPSVKTYILSFAETGIRETLKQSDNEVLQKLGKNNFAHVLTLSSPQIFDALKGYFCHELNEGELLIRLSKAGEKIGAEILDAYGIDTSKLKADPGLLRKVSGAILLYQASMAVYKEYSKAKESFEIAREERLRAEAICKETVAYIKEYRSLMEKRVSEYLNLRLDTIAESFASMDKAILENDVDGFISGNVEIQKMLGYNTQFTTQEEFDRLMDSDIDFKL